MTWYHGGFPGLEPGDLILPAATETGAKSVGDLDPHCRRDRVYATSILADALVYAGLAAGDVYEVEPAEPIEHEGPQPLTSRRGSPIAFSIAGCDGLTLVLPPAATVVCLIP